MSALADPVARAHRDAKILAAVRAGETQTAAAERHGVSRAMVGKIVAAAAEQADRAALLSEFSLEVALDRLELLLAAVWPQAMDGDIRAGTEALKILDQQARLQGLYRSEPAPLGRQAVEPRAEPDELAKWRADRTRRTPR